MLTPREQLINAIEQVPPGSWAVGVSGGADSVALLSLLRERVSHQPQDLRLHVVHLDHQTRGDASTADAAFVASLAREWGLACAVARRDELESVTENLPGNPSARFRALRLALYRRVVEQRDLQGVLLAHHADDQAETVLHRLLRGSGIAGLAGMSVRSCVGGLTIVRPLLGVRRDALREHLREIGQAWREDASNQSDDYARNRIRRVLADRPGLVDALHALAEASRAARDWTDAHAPHLGGSFRCSELADLPEPLARAAAARWLAAAGVPPEEVSPQVVDQLLHMAADAASPARLHFPGAVLVRRRRNVISVDQATRAGARRE